MPARLMHTRSLLLAIGMLAALSAPAKETCAAGPTLVAQGNGTEAPHEPQMVVDHEGTIHMTYGRGNSVLYCRSTDQGQSFSQPVAIPDCGVISLGMRRGPRISLTKEAICISVVGGKQGKGRDGDVLASTSLDGGKTWQGPVRVNDVESAAREGMHAMAASSGGALCCTWLDLRNKRTEIVAATSADGGLTWTRNQLVYSSPDGSVCECCHPSVAYSPKGELHVMWRNSLAGNRDMYLVTSQNGGKTFSQAEKLGNVTWKLDACPMDGGSLALSSDGALFTAWRREADIYFTSPGDSAGKLIGQGKQPWTAATAKGGYVVWQADRTNELLLLGPGARKPVSLVAKAQDAVIAASPDGKGPLVVAWEVRESAKSAIHCLVLDKGN